jgi:putative transcriptional regulator
MNKIDINNLTGKCLIAMPDATDEFAQSVIYICSHGKDGAMGFIVNHRLKEFSFSDLAVELPFSFHDKSLPISLYNGGPLDKTKGFILHSDEYQLPDSINTGGGIAVSSSLEVLKDIASGKGPKQRLIALGYAGWAPDQLEKEILNNQWLVVEASQDLVLGSKDTSKWVEALSSLGIDNINFSTTYGHS